MDVQAYMYSNYSFRFYYDENLTYNECNATICIVYGEYILKGEIIRMKMTIGIDVGNYDTKTQHTTTPSSFRSSHTENKLNAESLFYDGTYYVTTTERNNQQLDKTQNNYCVIISLFAIAKEIIWRIENDYKEKNGKNAVLSGAELQKQIDQVKEIVIGVGLPAGHFSSLAQKTVDCYMDNLKDGFTFTYKDLEFHLRLTACNVYPQDFTGVAYNPDIEIVRNFKDYYIIGIGGGTADVIPVEDGSPKVEKCRSIEKGTTIMYEYISTAIQHETGKTMDYTAIETILTNGPSIVEEKRKQRVKELKKEFVDKLVDDFVHIGLRLSDYPCVFVGGGVLMMRDALENNSLFVKTEIVEDVNINAKYYAMFASDSKR